MRRVSFLGIKGRGCKWRFQLPKQLGKEALSKSRYFSGPQFSHLLDVAVSD